MNDRRDQVFLDFKKTFGPPALFARAPGRINLIGEHTDYTGGWVFPAAIDRAVFMAVSEGRRKQNRIQSVDFQQVIEFGNWETEAVRNKWARYFQAMLWELKKRGRSPGMVDCSFGSTIPIGSGLSSSAAMCVGFLTAVNELFALEISKKEVAEIAQATEHRVGIRCGIMDMWASVFGRKGHALLLDCQLLEHEFFAVETGEWQLVLFDTKVKHALGDTPYNERRATCERVFSIAKKAFGERVVFFRDLGSGLLEELKNDLQPIDYQRVTHVLEENARVHAASKALKSNDLPTFGQLLFSSHESLSKKYEVSCAELDFIVDHVRKSTDVLGARMVGGGFGGCVLALVRREAASEIFENLKLVFSKKFSREPGFLAVEIADGAAIE